MKDHLKAIELAAVRIASDGELPKVTAAHLNQLLNTLVVVLNQQNHEIERLTRNLTSLQKSCAKVTE